MSTLRALAEGLWCVDHRDFSVGGLRLGTRTSVVRRPSGSLVLFSPGPLSGADREAIRALGAVGDIIVPNQLHTLFVEKAVADFPEARVYAVGSARAKRPGLRVDVVLGDGLPDSLADTFEVDRLDGARVVDERVFFHAPTRTLLGTDIAFNVRGATGFCRLAMWLNDANDKLCVTRLGKAQYLDDHAAAARSVDRICARFDFDRLVVAHGEVQEAGAREALHAAYAFGRAQ